MRILDQMSVLVAAADAGEGGGSLGVGVCGAAQGSGLTILTFLGAS